jgi:broad specificity polyphosphatase/5'/3'-nucleotidase SurE
MKVLISNDDGKKAGFTLKSLEFIALPNIGPPSLEESPFILPFIEHLENLGWNVK